MLNKANIYRLNCDSPLNDRRVYVCADNSQHAAEKAARLLADIYGLSAGDVSIYNITSYRECLAQGLSENSDWRLFESGWQFNEVISWGLDPHILTDHESMDFLRAVMGEITYSLKAETACMT